MTTYIFSPSSINSPQNWDSASIWSPQMVPNSATAVVVLPLIYNLVENSIVNMPVQILAGESFQVSELDVTYNSVNLFGALSAANEVTVGVNGEIYNYGTGGTLSAASLENDGSIGANGQFDISGVVLNRGSISGDSTITAGSFQNAGNLVGSSAGTGLTIVVANGQTGFANLSNGTLTGGTYTVGADATLAIDVNSPITTLAATASVYGGTLETYAASGTSYVALQSSLAIIARSGFLLTGVYANAGALTVDGVVMSDSQFSAPSLTVASSGVISLSAPSNTSTSVIVSGTITDNGAIVAVIDPHGPAAGFYSNSAVIIEGVVQGTGTLVIGPGVSYYNYFSKLSDMEVATVSLELSAADSASVLFADGTGSLMLDAPQSFTGTIKGFTKGDSITLSGVDLQSVLSYTYSGTSTQGVLSIVEIGGTTVTLALQGSYATADFSLVAGTQVLSSSPASVIITDTSVSAASYTATSAVAAYQAGTLGVGALIVTSASDVAANIDMLQTLNSAGDISTIVLTDLAGLYGNPTVPVLTVTAAQFLADSGALGTIDSAYSVSITGATALQAESIAGGARVSAIAVSDTTAHVGAQLDQLEALAATGQISSIVVTDSSFDTLSLTATQLTNDRTALGDMSGNFILAVSASAANLTLDGLSGHGITVIFSGTASDYSVTPSGDGIGLSVTDTGTGRTSTDSLRDVTALQFSDFTDIVAQTPGGGSAGTVTTGNVTELYGAVFGRLPDIPGLAYYQGELAANPTLALTTFAQWFLASPEYVNNSAHTYAQSTAGDTQFIEDSYTNLLHRAPESGAVPYYLAIIDKFTAGLTPGTAAYAAAQTVGHAYVLTDFSASTEFLADVQVTAQNPSSSQHWLILI